MQSALEYPVMKGRVIIAGSRDIYDAKLVESAIERSGFQITEVVCGGARGVDMLGANWAIIHKIPVNYFRPAWTVNGEFDRTAGFKRNIRMAENADGLIAVWDGKSRGTEHMIRTARSKNLPVFILRVALK